MRMSDEQVERESLFNEGFEKGVKQERERILNGMSALCWEWDNRKVNDNFKIKVKELVDGKDGAK